jgi:RNA polymerase sigma-70 factor (ECF subfamily)
MSLTATLCSPLRSTRPRAESERQTPRRTGAPRRETTRGTHRPRPDGTEGFAPTSDEDLLGRYRDAGRPEDFAELLRRYSGELSGFLARYLGDATLAEDVLQDTFLQVHTKCDLYQDGWPARPWLYAVATHRAVDALRRARRLPRLRLDPTHAEDEPGSLVERLADDESGPLEELQERERQEWVRESVARLPELLRQALVLTYYQGLSYAEVADLLAVPLGTVKSRLHGAIARMRAMAERSGRP